MSGHRYPSLQGKDSSSIHAGDSYHYVTVNGPSLVLNSEVFDKETLIEQIQQTFLQDHDSASGVLGELRIINARLQDLELQQQNLRSQADPQRLAPVPSRPSIAHRRLSSRVSLSGTSATGLSRSTSLLFSEPVSEDGPLTRIVTPRTALPATDDFESKIEIQLSFNVQIKSTGSKVPAVARRHFFKLDMEVDRPGLVASQLFGPANKPRKQLPCRQSYSHGSIESVLMQICIVLRPGWQFIGEGKNSDGPYHNEMVKFVNDTDEDLNLMPKKNYHRTSKLVKRCRCGCAP